MVLLGISTSLVLKFELSTPKLVDSPRPHIFQLTNATLFPVVNFYMQSGIFSYFNFPGVEIRTQRI